MASPLQAGHHVDQVQRHHPAEMRGMFDSSSAPLSTGLDYEVQAARHQNNWTLCRAMHSTVHRPARPGHPDGL